MKNNQKTAKLILIAIFFLVATFTLSGCVGGSQNQEEGKIKKQVKLQEITPQNEISTTLTVSGVIVPKQYSLIRSLTQGTLEYIMPAGSEIYAGQSLFQIRDDSIENNYFNSLQNLRQTNVLTDQRVVQAELALTSAAARLNLAEKNLENVIKQTEQALENGQDQAIINYRSSYNTLTQFYNFISLGAYTGAKFKYKNLVTSNIGLKELTNLQYAKAIEKFKNLPYDLDKNNLNQALLEMGGVLEDAKILADNAVLLLQQALGGVDGWEADKTLAPAYQGQINTHVNTILASQNSLRNILISNELTLDQAKNQLKLGQIESSNAEISLKNSRESSELEKTISQIQVDNAGYQFNNLSLRSPFSGAILSTKVEPGQQISIGQEILELGNLSIVEIKVEVDTEFAGGLKLGDKVKIKELYDGFISEIEPAGSIESGKVGIKVQTDNTQNFLAAGEIADVTFELLYKQENLIIIPINAATIETANTFVFVAVDGKAVKKTVTLGKIFGTSVSVVTGLNQNDKLILKNGVFISEGDELEILE